MLDDIVDSFLAEDYMRSGGCDLVYHILHHLLLLLEECGHILRRVYLYLGVVLGLLDYKGDIQQDRHGRRHATGRDGNGCADQGQRHPHHRQDA